MLEINILGVYVPAPLVWAGFAFLLAGLIERVWARAGFYAFVWHRALFDLSVFVISWGAISAVAYRMAFSDAGLAP